MGEEEKRGGFRLLASPDGADGSLTIHQDAPLHLASLLPGQAVSHEDQAGRAAWLQVLQGSVTFLGNDLAAGDGAAITDENTVAVQATVFCFTPLRVPVSELDRQFLVGTPTG